MCHLTMATAFFNISSNINYFWISIFINQSHINEASKAWASWLMSVQDHQWFDLGPKTAPWVGYLSQVKLDFERKEGTGEFHCIFMICKIIIYIFVNITRCDDKFKVVFMTDFREAQYIGGWLPWRTLHYLSGINWSWINQLHVVLI